MKRILFIASLTLLSLAAMAQRPHHQTFSESFTLTLKAAHNEAFVVYVDGDKVNRTPQREVVLDHLDNNTHDIYVVLTSPQEKINMMVYQPQNRREECRVHLDQRRGVLELLLPEQIAQPQNPQTNIPIRTDARPMPQTEHHLQHCSDHEVDQMVSLLHNESFDTNREKLAENFVKNHQLLSSQILRLCQEFSFSSSKVNFLKMAYHYCVDPENYAITTSALTFSTDRETILDYINRH